MKTEEIRKLVRESIRQHVVGMMVESKEETSNNDQEQHDESAALAIGAGAAGFAAGTYLGPKIKNLYRHIKNRLRHDVAGAKSREISRFIDSVDRLSDEFEEAIDSSDLRKVEETKRNIRREIDTFESFLAKNADWWGDYSRKFPDTANSISDFIKNAKDLAT